MGCHICGRNSCAIWMHSIEDQEDFENKTGKYSEDSDNFHSLTDNEADTTEITSWKGSI